MLVAREMEVFLHPLVSKSAIDAGNKNQPNHSFEETWHSWGELRARDHQADFELFFQMMTAPFFFLMNQEALDGGPYHCTVATLMIRDEYKGELRVATWNAYCDSSLAHWYHQHDLIILLKFFLWKPQLWTIVFWRVAWATGNRLEQQDRQLPRHAAEAAGRRRPRSWRDDECAEQERCQFWELAKIESHRKGLFPKPKESNNITPIMGQLASMRYLLTRIRKYGGRMKENHFGSSWQLSRQRWFSGLNWPACMDLNGQILSEDH